MTIGRNLYCISSLIMHVCVELDQQIIQLSAEEMETEKERDAVQVAIHSYLHSLFHN